MVSTGKLSTTAFRVPARDMCRLLQTALLGKFVRSDASFSFPYGYKHGNDSSDYRGGLRADQKTRTGQITDISKIAVRLMGFSYKKNCGRLPFGEVPAAVLFRFSFPTKPIRFLFVLADSTFFCRLVNVSFLMVSEFFLYLCACAAVLAWNMRKTPVCSINFVRL